MDVERLPWDSDFFGFEVGRVIVSKDDVLDAGKLRKAIEGLNVELAYVFLPGEVDAGQECHREVLVSMSGKLVDHKVTFVKRLVARAGEPTDVVSATSLTPEIESLAYGSGWCSRFAAEDRLRPFFCPMYKRWLQNDFRDGKVFVRLSGEGKPIGLTTVSVRNGIGCVGLMAVDAGHCRKGVATALLHAAEEWLLRQGVCECRVVTQHDNIAGMALYSRCGYEVRTRYEVWHVWKTLSA